jgi:hypothetical protein
MVVLTSHFYVEMYFNPFKSQWLLHVSPTLTYQNCILLTKFIVYFVWFTINSVYFPKEPLSIVFLSCETRTEVYILFYANFSV